MINYCSKYIIHDMTAMVASSVDIGWIVNNFFVEVVVRFVDIGGTVDHLCLAMVASSVDIGRIPDNFWFQVFVRFVDIGW